MEVDVIHQPMSVALDANQLTGRSTQPDEFGERNLNNLPVIPYNSSHQDAQDAFVRNAKSGRPSYVFFHSHETQGKGDIAEFYRNLANAIRKGQIETIPFPKSPRWDGNPPPQKK